MKLSRPFALMIPLSIVLVSSLGCGDANIVPVSGTITYKGKPVANAFVHFVPEKGRPSMGETDAQGRFELKYDRDRKGAERGKHKVSVEFNPTASSPDAEAIPGMPVEPPKDMKEVFEKYSTANTPATVDLTKAENDLKLNWD